MSSELKNILIPNVTRTPQQKSVDKSNQLPKEGEISEFKELLNSQIESKKPLHDGINLSSHAAQRLQERKIDFNGEEYAKVKKAMVQLKEKGGQKNTRLSTAPRKGGGSRGQKVLCGELKSFCRMQNLVKASTSLNSAHQEQLIAPCLGANGPRGRSNHLPNEI